jgi:opacity protein-like surface antigen
MKKVILSSVISLAVVGSAWADEPASPFNGFYIGGGLTYVNGKINNKGGNTGGNDIWNVSSRGVGFNGFLGYGTYFGGFFYIGAELGLGYDGSRFSNKRAGYAVVNGTSTAVRFKGRSTASYGAAGRLGFLISNVLPYVKVGFEGHSAVKFTTTDGTQIMFGGKSVTLRRNGLVLGGGVDYGLTTNVFVRVEYAHNFGTRSSFSSNGVKIADFRTATDTFLIGAGYRY